MDSLSTAVVLVDRQLSVCYANPASEQLLGQSTRRCFTDNDVTIVVHDGHHLTVDVTATPLDLHGRSPICLI